MAERPIEDTAVDDGELARRGLGTDLAVHVAQGVATGAAGAVATHYLRRPEAAAPPAPAPEDPPPAAPKDGE